MVKEDVQLLINQMCKIIEITVNNNTMTLLSREAYLNASWKIIMEYIRENRK